MDRNSLGKIDRNRLNILLVNKGFNKNTRVINGHKPHYINNDGDVLFLIGKDYWGDKIYCKINPSFKNFEAIAFGVLTPNAPRVAYGDWITATNLVLLHVNDSGDLFTVTWAENGNDLKFIPITI